MQIKMIKNFKNYLKDIKNFTQFNKNIFLSYLDFHYIMQLSLKREKLREINKKMD